ncbi:regulator of Vps4 activity in the MVB pathway-domain-containing protein [Multifurca ochricompacta]|uniref:Regulator of Vps4 activity in the MVB pathway-domain-containing protein n=1 Tax=Multifurca ochricompacta TaxID=376703 RepID=A0AAD4MA63_9AGAM|nr:regulator of Vps4 activity in the MVB pathway-domain-containing protein [Multifurca ochricompacta]
MITWDSMGAKAQLRLTAQRLGQLRDRKDAQGQVIGKDISILLQHGSETLARSKAQRLMQDEVMGDLFENLEMQIGVLLERFSELESGNLSPVVVEAASTVIFVAPHVDSRDLLICRELLGVRLGPHFLHAADTNKDQYVSKRAVQALSAPPASAADMRAYLAGIARSYNIQWTPEYQPSDVLGALSEILDKSGDKPAVDTTHLRPCGPFARAIFQSSSSDIASDTSRRCTTGAIKDLFRVPASLLSSLEEEPESFESCPLDPLADAKIKISCAANLDIRLKAINQCSDDSKDLPEIRLEGEIDVTPEISVTSPGAEGSAPSQTLIPSHSVNIGGAHPKHASALIRLLYIHSCLNPANHSPHMASLLIPLYSVLLQEVESPDVAHVEADTFWLFEAMVGEFAELEAEESGNEWMGRFGDRLQWADPELSTDLMGCINLPVSKRSKGLDPGLPHYSYRWLAPLLIHTLPLPSVLSIWDALFACPMTTRDSSPKLDALLDVCTSMLIRMRGPLFRLGKTGRHSPSLWTEENLLLGPPSPLLEWELNDAFIEGMSLLQKYPLESAGGVDSILQTAVELRRRRDEESQAAKANTTLGSRLRDTIWRGFTNQGASPPSSPDMSDGSEEGSWDGDETETVDATSSTPSFTSRLANAVWQGVTNQSSMEVPPSPVSPLPPSPASPFPTPSPASPLPPQSAPSSPSRAASSLWSYAEKIRDSDTAASLAKVSTNWRVKAFQAWDNRSRSPSSPNAPSSQVRQESEPASPMSSQKVVSVHREGSVADTFRKEAYSPPARPAYFRPPRDSILPLPKRSLLSSPTPESGDDIPSTQARSIRDSIASLAGLAVTTPLKPSSKSGPRPLLLSSSPLLTRSAPASVRTPPAHPKGNSMSPTTLYTSEIVKTARRHDSHSEWESDTIESRIVPLNRQSVSPMAPQARTGHGRLLSSSSEKGVSGQELLLNSPSGRSDGSANRGWSRIDALDSPMTLPASPPLHTPPFPIATLSLSGVSGADSQGGSVVISESSIRVLEAPSQARKLVRKKTPPPSRVDYTSDSSAAPDALPRSPRLRSKRTPQHLAKLYIHRAGSLEVDTSPNTLAPPDFIDDHDNALTPRAAVFHETNGENSASSASSISPAPSPHRTRKLSGEGRKTHGDNFEPRARKISPSSHSPRTRKAPESRSAKRAESAAEEGDDEGYDELLSAYESEDSAIHRTAH